MSPEPRKPKRRRRPGRGSVYQLKRTGQWVAQVSLQGKPRRFVTRWCRTRYEAEQELRVLLERHAFSSPDDRHTVAELVGQWLRMQAPRLSPSSRVAYDFRLRVMLPTLGAIPIGRLRVSDVERFVALRLADGKSPASVADSVGLLGSALESAVRDGVLPRNVARLAKLPPIERPKVKGMNAEEARAVLDATKGTPVETLTALLLGSGLRIGEALALDWSDVDLREGVVRVRGGKTVNAERSVPIPIPTTLALKAHRRRFSNQDSIILGGLAAGRHRGNAPSARSQDSIPFSPASSAPPPQSISGAVFTTRGERMTHQQAYRALRGALQAHGLPHYHPHQLRHAHASLLLAAGVDMRTIADQLGHAKASLTSDIYAHSSAKLQREAVDRLEDVL